MGWCDLRLLRARVRSMSHHLYDRGHDDGDGQRAFDDDRARARSMSHLRDDGDDYGRMLNP